MLKINNHKLSDFCVERPVGTEGNNKVIEILSKIFNTLKYNVIELPIDCNLWQADNSFIEQNSNKIEIFPSPYSQELKGNFPIQYVSNIEEIAMLKNYKGVLIFVNDLVKNSVFPKNFPFYFPDEDKLLYDIIERVSPKGIIAITKQDPVSGLNPFPIFEDVNLKIPTAYVSSLEKISDASNISIEINSKIQKVKSKQLIFRKEGLSKDIILIAAHLDTKYRTDGAIDNASGLYVLCEVAKIIKDKIYGFTIEIVPFNGEDSPEVPGQLAYLNYLKENNYQIKSVINIDGVGYIGSKNMFSFFNYDENIKAKIVADKNILEGEQWYGGDHSIFAFQSIPCIAVTSSNMFTDAIKLTHTINDKIEFVDTKTLEALAKSIGNVLTIINEK
ncbi:MAG: M28 family peptidase [Bacteroidetes bacterium]|nr:M28 family peptidase [Bacteroidota bacterium]